MPLSFFSRKSPKPSVRRSHDGDHEQQDFRNTAPAQVSPLPWSRRPYVFLYNNIWPRFLKIVPYRRRWSWNLHMSYIAEELTCIALLAGVTLAIEKATPTFHLNQRTIILRRTPNDTFLPPDALLYPKQELPKWMDTTYNAIIVTVGPTLIYLAFQLKLKSFYDFHAAVAGTLKAIFMASLACTILKRIIGRCRPHFWELCKPVIANGAKQDALLFYVKNCGCDARVLANIVESFPSGHTACSTASAVFLLFYLNGKLKTFADHTAHFGIIILTLLPLLVSFTIAGILTAVNQHHSEDVLFGLLLGTMCGFISYRSEYAGVFDFRRNHIPLPLYRFQTQIYVTPRDRIEHIHFMDELAHEQSDKMLLWCWWKFASAGEIEKNKERDYLISLRNYRKLRLLKTLPLWKERNMQPPLQNLKSKHTQSDHQASSTIPSILQSRAPSVSLGLSTAFSASFGRSLTNLAIHSKFLSETPGRNLSQNSTVVPPSVPSSTDSIVQSRGPSIELSFSSSFSPDIGDSIVTQSIQPAAHPRTPSRTLFGPVTAVVSAPPSTTSTIVRNRASSSALSLSSSFFPSFNGSFTSPVLRPATSTATLSEVPSISSETLEDGISNSFFSRVLSRSAPPEVEPTPKWATWSSHI